MRSDPELTTYKYLFDHDGITNWFENNYRGSRTLAGIYLRRLGAYCVEMDTDPTEVARTDPNKMYRQMTAYVELMEARTHLRDGHMVRYSPGYIESTLKAIRSWLAYNDIVISRRIRISNAQERPTLVHEQSPSPEQVRQVIRMSNLRSRTAISIMAYAGVRPMVLGNDNGTDGLTVGDITDLVVGQDITWAHVPALVYVRAPISKTRIPYRTFLPQAACDCLRDLLMARMHDGERITSDTVIIRPHYSGGRFISSTNIGDLIRKGIRGAGFRWRPYALRGFFDVRLLIAESRTLIPYSYRQYWMGHRGDIEAQYTTHRHLLPEDVVENMRSAYDDASWYLFNERLSNDQRQRLISHDDVEQALQRGWRVLQQLQDGRVVVERQR